jgi:ribonucleoside-diphosphate reductase alpha chain
MTVTDTRPAPARKSRARKGVKVERIYTTPGVNPYDQVTWEQRDVSQTNWKSGEVVFEQKGVEFPDFWSLNASTIVTTKYFRGAVGTPEREHRLRDLIERVVAPYVATGKRDNYFASDEDADIFGDELRHMLLHQVFSFNSPVWFNVGTSSPQQVSACFILAVEDSMDSILNWYREEGLIFKGGSGAGLNLSRIRSSKELLSSGGTASGPVSFMRGADASAGTIKSGGATRRAAKMVVLDVDHPDIEEFVETKMREEDKIRALRDAGYDMDLGGRDIVSVQYQNANNSVRVSDEFMRAVQDGTEFGLRARSTGEVIETVDARDLWGKINLAAWACADPGIQYNDTINAWHTTPASGPITASNPCSEYMSLDNSSCNLASLNLMKFRREDGAFDSALFVKAVEFIITAMEISISFADFPTEPIGDTTRRFRQLGIGYANLGAYLMASGLAYDSPEGRALGAAVTSLMTGTAYRRSAEIAGVVGAYDGYKANEDSHKSVMRKHRDAAAALVAEVKGESADFVAPGIVTTNPAAADIAEVALDEWGKGLEIGEANGWRNAQASVLAPTGTIGFMMDCDTTGVEPAFSLVQFKKMVGGASLQIAIAQVSDGARALGYTETQTAEIAAFVVEHGHVVGAPYLSEAHYSVFDCALGERAIEPMGHVRMMAAAQPFLSGAISKTVNMPADATVEDIADIYMQSWLLGLKATAVYRDNCKVGQPLSDAKGKDKTEDQGKTEAAAAPVEKEIVYVEVPKRERLPQKRKGENTSFTVGDAEGYLQTFNYPDGRVGEVFFKMANQGSTLAGVMDAFSTAISLALQYGVPLETLVEKFVNRRFEPAGYTEDPDIKLSQSVVDYAFRRIALDYLPIEKRQAMGIFSMAERMESINGGAYDAPAKPAQDEVAPAVHIQAVKVTAPVAAVAAPVTVEEAPLDEVAALLAKARANAPDCSVCGTNANMQRAGACWICECGTSTGCS